MARRLLTLLVATWFMAAGAAGAQDGPAAAGRFLAVTGEVGVLGGDGARRVAERGAQLREGDTVITGEDALAQVRMADGGLLSVRAATEVKLDRFSFAGEDDRRASFVMSIIKGGFRTITGLIARANRRGYRITTPSATIGVRGTHFEVVHVLPQASSPEAPAGTYNRVFEGITTMQNPAGAILQVVREQTAFAALQGGAPVLVRPPAAIFGRPTPVPRASTPTESPDEKPTAAQNRGDRSARIRPGMAVERQAMPGVRDRPSISPLDTEAIQRTPALTPLDPTPTVRTMPLSPIDPVPALRTDPSTTMQTAPSPTILQQPTPTFDRPTTILQQPVTTTLQQPTTTIRQPTTTILQPPTTTIKQPSTTISPTLTR